MNDHRKKQLEILLDNMRNEELVDTRIRSRERMVAKYNEGYTDGITDLLKRMGYKIASMDSTLEFKTDVINALINTEKELKNALS